MELIIKESGIRLDKALADLTELSRSQANEAIKNGNILVNGKAVKAKYSVKEGDLVTYDLPEPEVLEYEAEDIPLDIVYEDDDVAVVNKPQGMVVHPSVGHTSGTLVNALMYHCGSELSGINGVLRPGIVHRIDMDTTGSLIVCKSDLAHQRIAEQLKEHSINRVYEAIVHGNLKAEAGTINAPIGRDPRDRKKMSVHAKNSRPAVTHYQVIERFGQFTYIRCRLETGRTHQIRVHMGAIGHPILGDPVYGPKKCPFPSLQGQTLHARTIGIIHPRTGEYLEVEAPLPTYFVSLLEKLRG